MGVKGTVEKAVKPWTIRDANGKKVDLTPVFEVAGEETGNPDVEAKLILLKTDKEKFVFNFINLFQFVYFVASEELRRSLMLRYERRINRIPYDVTFKLSEDEIKNKMATRRIEVPIDELSMSIARNEAFKLMPGVHLKLLDGEKPWNLFKKGRK